MLGGISIEALNHSSVSGKDTIWNNLQYSIRSESAKMTWPVSNNLRDEHLNIMIRIDESLEVCITQF